MTSNSGSESEPPYLLLARGLHLWNCARLFPPKRYHSGTAVVTFSLMAFAIIKTGGRQYRVEEGDTIDVDLLEAEPGKQVVIAEVLVHADGDKLTHGAPIDGARVTAEVIEQRKDKKVVAYKFKRRKGYHRTVGHRRRLTRLKIKSISVGAKKSTKKETD